MRRLPLIVALVAAFALGMVAGVALDRSWLRSAIVRTFDSRLLGLWIHGIDRSPLEFKADGTVEGAQVTTIGFEAIGAGTSHVEKVTGQYRWIDDETIEMIFPHYPVWVPIRLALEGNRLTLLKSDGSVDRYTRAE